MIAANWLVLMLGRLTLADICKAIQEIPGTTEIRHADSCIGGFCCQLCSQCNLLHGTVCGMTRVQMLSCRQNTFRGPLAQQVHCMGREALLTRGGCGLAAARNLGLPEFYTRNGELQSTVPEGVYEVSPWLMFPAECSCQCVFSCHRQ